MERVESDHNPLFIKCGDSIRVKRPWRFQNIWLEDARFYEGLETWVKIPLRGYGRVFRWVMRLQDLKWQIKDWNKNVFGNINQLVEDSLGKIKALDLLEEARSLSEE
ncbi:unnamed protein product [Linum trigynum]|uniref:Reverse transcriptase n=1 Tax=Linum trigynum TaxID=586398 RepID=A0AAV2FB45_9ROSI